MLAAGLFVAAGVLSAQADVILMPNFNGTADDTIDLIVNFDATQASCYQKTYPVTDDGIDISCDAGFCANAATASCNTYRDCLATCGGNSTCIDANGSDTGFSCVADGDCWGVIEFDKDNPIITQLGCDYNWDTSAGTGVQVGGSGTDTIVVQYGAPGTYEAILTMSVADPENPGETVTASRTTQVSPVDLPDPPVLGATFTLNYTAATCGNMTCFGGLNPGSACSAHADCLGNGEDIADGRCYGECVGGTKDGIGCDDILAADELPGPECPGADVTLTIDSMDSSGGGIARAYVNWGDRSRKILNYPAVNDATAHTYNRDRHYNGRVTLIDYDRNKTIIPLSIN